MKVPHISLPNDLLREWQQIVDLVARLAQVRVSLVMRRVDNDIEVLIASDTACNPYHPGDREHLLGSGLYCEEVIRSNDKLLVANASASARWKNNPDMKHGLVSYLGFPIRLPDGTPFGTLCLLDDKENAYSADIVSLLEKMRDLAEEHLRFAEENRLHRIFASESLLRQILENQPIPIAVCSTQEGWDILFMNKQFSATFGYTMTDLRSVDDWLQRTFPDPQRREAATNRWRSGLLRTRTHPGTIDQRQVSATCRDGSIKEVLISNITIGDCTIMSLIDITAQNRIEEELKQAKEAAEAASRAKSDFLGRVSHDLRSPLTSIIGYSQLMTVHGGQVTKQAKIIHRSARHMLSLVNDLIDYAVCITGRHVAETPMYVLGVLDSIAQEARMLAQHRGNRFELDITDDLPPVLSGDAKHLRRILLNLLDNAAKFTTNGTIELGVACQAAADVPGTVQLAFTVNDSGCGIALADQPRVFDPFFRTHDSGQTAGSGLGLSIVHALVSQMGGELELASHPGQGTRVRVRLPLRVASEAAMNEQQILEASGTLPMLNGNGHRIWLVEDTEEIRRLLQDALMKAGFIVHAAANGQEFIEHMQAPEAIPPALVLTDYLMPQADGAAVLAAVRRVWPAVPVVLLSATQQSMESLALHASSGFSACLMKPVDLGELYLTLARLLDLHVDAGGSACSTAAPPACAADEDVPSFAALPPEVQASIRHLIQIGAVTDLRDYAEALLRQHPAHRAFACRMEELAANSDLDALSALTGQP